MPDNSTIHGRKADHIRINLEEKVNSALTTGLEAYHFTHRALPEIDLQAVDTSQVVFGKRLAAPLLISSMTGGTEQARTINLALASAAQQTNIALGVGSQRAGIEQPNLEDTFRVRRVAPDVLLFANLGAVQLNYGYSVEHCRRAVDMIEADALILHFNALQEALQPEGDTHFDGLARRVGEVCARLGVPVIAKEVGWGFSEADVRLLAEAGVAAIDVAGAGGTSWSQVEMHRAKTPRQAQIAAAFVDWGIPTAEAISNVRKAAPQLPVFASGGLRSGVDIAKCSALGAALCGLASPFLKAATVSEAAVADKILDFQHELRVCMFAVGAANLDALAQPGLLRKLER